MERSPAEVRKAFRITGRVQGVGFRWWAWRCADQLGVRGTIRNSPDGSVQVEVAGAPEAVARLRAMLADGPPAALVRAVEDVPPTEQPLPDSFDIVG